MIPRITPRAATAAPRKLPTPGRSIVPPVCRSNHCRKSSDDASSVAFSLSNYLDVSNARRGRLAVEAMQISTGSETPAGSSPIPHEARHDVAGRRQLDDGDDDAENHAEGRNGSTQETTNTGQKHCFSCLSVDPLIVEHPRSHRIRIEGASEVRRWRSQPAVPKALTRRPRR